LQHGFVSELGVLLEYIPLVGIAIDETTASGSIADAVVFLLSPRASFVHGSIVGIAEGQTWAR
jgi:hypothetical protein